MFSESRIKLQAKGAMSFNNNWGKSIAITIIMLCIYSVLNSFNIIAQHIFNVTMSLQSIADSYLDPYFYFQLIDHFVLQVYMYLFIFLVACILLWVLIVWPLSLGIRYWCYDVANNTSPSISVIFRYFSCKNLYLKAISFKFNLFLRCFFRFVVCLLPAVIMFFIVGELTIFSNISALSRTNIFLLYLSVLFLFICGLLAFGLIILRFFLASYFFILDDHISGIKCIDESYKKMKGKCFGLVRLLITFIPWMLSCFFILPILYVYPYLQISLANFAKWLMYDIAQSKQQS